MSEELEPCPCGETPKELCITDQDRIDKWKNVYGDCCSEWSIEFKAHYKTGEELKKLAIEGWNDAKRLECRNEYDTIAKHIHYPDCWDTVTYPTLLDAIKEIYTGCTECEVKE